MSSIWVLAASTSPGCAGQVASTDLLHPKPDWPALACSAPSSVNPGKSLSSDPSPLPNPYSSKVLAPVSSSSRNVSMHPEDLVHSTDSQAFANEGELGLRSPTQLNALMHCSEDVCFRKVGLRQSVAIPLRPSQCSVTVCCCGDCGQSADFRDFPFWIRVVQVWHVVVADSFLQKLRDKGRPALDGTICHRHQGSRHLPTLHCLGGNMP